MDSTFHDRRQFERVHIVAYGQNKTCILVLGGQRCQADLIDISAGGARIRLAAPPAFEGKDLSFSVSGVDDKGLLQNLTAKICWQNGQELGIRFLPELETSIGALQRLVC